MIDPVTGMLISSGANLLGGLLAPNPEKQKEKYAKKAMGRKIDATNKYLKPKQERYNLSRNLPQFDDLVKRMSMGMAKTQLGDRAKDYGIDFDSMFGALAQPAAQAGPTAPPNGGVNLPPEQPQSMYVDALMRKYKMEP